MIVAVGVALLFAVIWAIDFAFVTTCPFCHQRTARSDLQNRRRDTQYSEHYEDMNWLESCGGCYAEDCEIMAERWAEYYSGCM